MVSHLSGELAEEPLELGLEDTFTSDAEGITEGVESAFGRIGLPATVKQLHKVFPDGGNVVAVEIDLADAFGGLNRGVAVLPVLIGLDSGDHCLLYLAGHRSGGQAGGVYVSRLMKQA